MSEGKCWLVTCTTFGTWLPGDPRGFQTWRGERYIPPPERYAKPGEPVYDPKAFEAEYELSKDISGEAVYLTVERRKVAAEGIVEELTKTTVLPIILAVGKTHLHFFAKFGALRIRPTMGRLKAAATRKLHGENAETDRVWTRGCHMKSKSTQNEIIGSYKYVADHEEEGASIVKWPENMLIDFRCD